ALDRDEELAASPRFLPSPFPAPVPVSCPGGKTTSPVVSPVLGSHLAQLGNNVCLHLLKRPEQLVKPFRAHGRSKREEGAAGKRSAAKGTLELHDARAIIVGVVVTPGQRLRQATHRVAGALIERAQRRSRSRALVTKERI